MATIFNYVLAETFPLTYKVFTGDTQIGVLKADKRSCAGFRYSFFHQQSGAKINFGLSNRAISGEPLLAFEKQLARIADAIYPPLMAHLSNP